MPENMPVKNPLRVLSCLLAAALWLAAMPARAALMGGLYEARVPVTDQSTPQRNAALQQAFDAVLVKVTGNRAAMDSLAASLGSPSQYIQQYRYEQVPADPAVPGSLPGLLLWAKFDAGVIAKALQAAHAPLWGAERPRTLVWLALPDAPGGRILTAGDGSPLMQALLTAAEQRGIVLVFPQMDGPDRAAVGVPDVVGFNADRLAQASTRYRADALLVGSLGSAGGGQYLGRWQLMPADHPETWDSPPGDEAVVAVDGVQTAADRFAERYAIVPNAQDQDGVALEVDGITSLDAYAKVLAYLNTLTPVRAVHVQRVAQGSVFYSVDIHGSVPNLQSALALGGMLAAAPAPAPVAATGMAPASVTALRYSYVP
jgi:hypothetical protein